MGNRVAGKVALVTGAARGQGRSHAVRLAQEGADIVALDICHDIDEFPYPMGSSAELAETVEIVEALDRRVVAMEADVRDFAAVERVVTAGVAEFGRLDIVAANAGLCNLGYMTWEATEEAFDAEVDVLLKGVWNTFRAVVPPMIEAGNGGAIIATSSLLGLKAMPGVSIYSAAKAGVIAMADSLANEVAPYGIRVNTIHPTNVSTDLIWKNETLQTMFTPDLGRLPTREELAVPASGMNILWDPRSEWKDHPIPWVEAVDISNGVLFLASDEARFVTGQKLSVDLGARIK
jgi:SDR family mycofactocin-dependent oxidoreductase